MSCGELRLWSVVPLLLLITYGVQGDPNTPENINSNQVQPSPPPVVTMVTRRSGLRYYDIVVGEGESPVFGEVVDVHYTASYASWWTDLTIEYHDGTVYDSSRERNAPFEFTVGSHRVTSGMNEVTETMNVGGRRIAFVPASLGYGLMRIGEVPSNSTLIYDIELLAVKGLDERGTWGVFNDTIGPHTDPMDHSYPPSISPTKMEIVDDPADTNSDPNSTDYSSDYSSNWQLGYDNDTAVLSDYDDYSLTHQYIEEMNDVMSNVSSRLDVMLGAEDGSVATGASWVFEVLAAMSIIAVLLAIVHWLYSQHKKKQYFTRLREDFIDNELEMDEL